MTLNKETEKIYQETLIFIDFFDKSHIYRWR